MSTLTKLFIILVLVAAVGKLGIDVALYAMRMDFKDKWIREANNLYQTKRILNEKLAEKEEELSNISADLKEKSLKIKELEGVLSKKDEAIKAKEDAIQKLQLEKQELSTRNKELSSDLKKIKDEMAELAKWLERYKKEKEDAIARADSASQKLLYLEQEKSILQREFEELQKMIVDLRRENLKLSGIIEELRKRNVPLEGVEPAKPINGKVLAVSEKAQLVILNITKEDGLKAGMELTVFRGNKFIATVVVDKVRKDHSVARIRLKEEMPKVGDSVSNLK
jgi:chromosome segregation ATPase